MTIFMQNIRPVPLVPCQTYKVCGHGKKNQKSKTVLMDSDVPLTQQNRDFAAKHKIHILQSCPICLEGMLLEVLHQRSPETNKACKALLHSQLSGPAAVKSSYVALFTKMVLDKTTKETIQALRKVLLNI